MRFSSAFTGAALVALIAAAPARAGIVNGADFPVGQQVATIDGITWTTAPTGRTFQRKSSGTPARIGIGLSGGRTGDEIDTDEVLIGTWSAPRIVTSFTLGLLYDGPEFDDVQEVAQVTFRRAIGPDLVFTLTNLFDANTGALPVWTGPGTVVAISDDEGSNTASNGAIWQVTNLALSGIVGVSFTALAGTCGNGRCTNQSDYTLVQFVTAVPEPASLALLGAGLLGLGFAARRRKAA